MNEDLVVDTATKMTDFMIRMEAQYATKHDLTGSIAHPKNE